MAAKVLQIANSPVFNLQNRTIETIGEAVVLVGFNSIRELAISVSVLEELKKGLQHEQCARLMSRAFHAAAHSKFISQIKQASGGEDVFVAALLKDVGPMAFWSRAGDQGDQLARALEGVPSALEEQVEQDFLGFSLQDLGQTLALDWCLGDLLNQVLKNRSDHLGVKSVMMGHKLAKVIEENSIESDIAQRSIRELAQQLNLPASEVCVAVEENFSAAADLVRHLGLPAKPETEAKAWRSEDTLANQSGGQLPADGQRVLEVLDELAMGMEEGWGRDRLMERVVQSLPCALGYQGGAFALFTPARDQLVLKYRSGAPVFETNVIPLAQLPMDVLAPGAAKVETRYVDKTAIDWATVLIKQKPVGVLFGLSSATLELDAKRIGWFRQMAQQLALILTSSN